MEDLQVSFSLLVVIFLTNDKLVLLSGDNIGISIDLQLQTVLISACKLYGY
jgi:hypothetical protein